MAHTTFPADLPVPVDDGACDHLQGLKLPSVALPSTATDNRKIDLSTLPSLSVVFCYPRTGAPNEVVPDEWNAIPGARGCTPQACSFRDKLPALKAAGVSEIFGISTQTTEYQQEMKERNHLPYDILSDEDGELRRALNLPTLLWKEQILIKRLSLAIQDGEIVKCWYPVFPPDKNIDAVLEWLSRRE